MPRNHPGRTPASAARRAQHSQVVRVSPAQLSMAGWRVTEGGRARATSSDVLELDPRGAGGVNPKTKARSTRRERRARKHAKRQRGARKV